MLSIARLKELTDQLRAKVNLTRSQVLDASAQLASPEGAGHTAHFFVPDGERTRD